MNDDLLAEARAIIRRDARSVHRTKEEVAAEEAARKEAAAARKAAKQRRLEAERFDIDNFSVASEMPFVEPKEKWRKANLDKQVGYTKKYKQNNPEKVAAQKQRAGNNGYHRPFVTIDAEGRDFPGDDIIIDKTPRDKDGTPLDEENLEIYPLHRTNLWGAGGWKREHSATELEKAKGTPDYEKMLRKGENLPTHWLEPAEPQGYLSSQEIIEFLLSLPAKYDASVGCPDGVNFISFAFNYDATQIFHDLPKEKVWEICRRKSIKTKRKVEAPVLCGEYVIDYLKSKWIKLWRLRDRENPYKEVFDKKTGKMKRVLDTTDHITIYDTFGFYQSPFVKVSSSLVEQGYVTKEEADLIKTTKSQRSDFADKPMSEIKEYCALELTTCSKALTILRDGFDRMGIHLKTWSGAGSASAALIRKHNLKKLHYSPDIATHDLTPQQDHAHHAYFGGRIELVRQGYAINTPLWNYDIASAYPAGMVELPSMRDGRWIFHEALFENVLKTVKHSNILSMFKVKWSFPLCAPKSLDKLERQVPFYPFPYRRKSGAILFPREGYAWIMRDECAAGLEWQKLFGGEILIEKWNEFIPGNDEQPYAFILDLYNRRAEIKAKTRETGIYDIQENAIKLSVNSSYGKTAQSTGGTIDKPPPCACIYYASAITAYCRARALTASLLDPFAIVSFMTDGIISTRPLKKLPRVHDMTETGDKIQDAKLKDIRVPLGDWELNRLKGGVFLQSGVYCLINWQGKDKSKTRGTNPANYLYSKDFLTLINDDILPAWKEYKGGPDIPKVEIQLKTYITAGAAVASDDRWKLRGRWAKITRRVDIHAIGTKRMYVKAQVLSTDGGKKINGPLSHHTIKMLEREAKLLDREPNDIFDTFREGLAFRCTGLVTSLATVNDTPDTLSPPNNPDWINREFGLLKEEDFDTAEILMANGD